MAKYFSLMIVPDGVESPFGIKMRAWLFKTLVVLAILFVIAVILFFSFYGKIIARAALADRLEKENEDLKRYKYKVGLLEEKMNDTREIVGRISQLAGVDIELPELPSDSVLFASFEKTPPAIMTRSVAAGDGRPDGLPLQGYMTRGFRDDSAGYHPGIDIAATIGTPVLATASGTVTFAGEDSVYGLIVIIEHDDGISTLYGHNSEILVEEGSEVLVGGRIALSGNTGKSTAPHLHYEIRENNQPVNPLKYISYDEESHEQK
nr:M23 family metallopeptidase [candidate division Zixibacteria bacterium]